MYLAREKRSRMVVAIKTITKKEILRSGIVDLLDNEITVQLHLK